MLVRRGPHVNRRVLHEQIIRWEMRSGSYAGAAQALQAPRAARAAGDPYQVALLDYQMPEMDGATLAALIKADPFLSDTVVIMLTSVGQWSAVRDMQGASIDAWLVKPVRQSQLLTTLATAWSKKLQHESGSRLPVSRMRERPLASKPTACNRRGFDQLRGGHVPAHAGSDRF